MVETITFYCLGKTWRTLSALYLPEIPQPTSKNWLESVSVSARFEGHCCTCGAAPGEKERAQCAGHVPLQ